MKKLFSNGLKSINRNLKSSALVIAAVIFILSIANVSAVAASEAVVLDFDSLPTGTFTQHQEDGFNIQYIGYGDLQTISEVATGNNVLKDSAHNVYGAEVCINSLDGVNFYFNSLDYNNFNNYSGYYGIHVTAIKYDGTVTNVNLNPTSSSFSTLTSTALGVDGIELRQIRVNIVSGNADYSVDNIKLQPAPASCTAPDNKTGVEATGVTTHVDLGSATSYDSNAIITSDAPEGMMFGLGTTTVTWTATNSVGSSTAQQIVEVVDTTKPSITVTVPEVEKEATAPYTAVDLFVNVSDLVSSGADLVVSNDAPTAGFPVGDTIVTWVATDKAGNCSTATQKITITDTTKPVFTSVPADVTKLSSGPTTNVDIGTAIATDIFAVNVTNDAPTAGFPVGDTTVTWTATDANGNETTATQKVTVYQYTFGGILQPINADGSSLFKLGSTVPVKFQLTGLGGEIVTDAVANISYAKFSGTLLGNDLEAVSTSSASSGSAFRYDSTSNQYIFNLNTKGWTAGTYQLTIKLNDGSSYTAKISSK